MRVKLEVHEVLEAPLLSSAWALYEKAFADLRTMAAQRHVMNHHEFDAVMADPRVQKHVALVPGTAEVTGLATFTNVLEAMPLISPEFFAHRWPQLYAQQKVWYLGFFAIADKHRGSGIFEAIIAQMWAQVHLSGGVASLDICQFNADMGLPDAIIRTLHGISPDMVASQADVQTYWAFTLDKPGH